MTTKPKPAQQRVRVPKLPTEFRACSWSAGWEFERPLVVYFPKCYSCFRSVGSIGEADRVIEDICMDISMGLPHNDGGLSQEQEFRGWGDRFDRREDADHVIFKGHWTRNKDNEPEWTEDSRAYIRKIRRPLRTRRGKGGKA